ncbi:hypothetical protein [Alteromonas aestuariivivens]|uniref:hypothetical protein n=1 Tax=Alteromonas aestuariivivens TaxID=1938339 RepID=UPI0011C05690|nr:hypothetical protein [Alteromonas aestuariivivens]
MLNTMQVFQQLGCEVQPLKHILLPRNLGHRSSNAVILNWYEDQLFRQNFSWFERGLFLGYFVLSVLLFPLLSKRVYWVRHNYKPHGLGKSSWVHRLSTAMLNRAAHKVVTLEPANGFESEVVKHPLYVSDRALLEAIDRIRAQRAAAGGASLHRFLYFGSIKPYKGVSGLLKSWPRDLPLTIAGLCQDGAYTATLKQIIVQRRLSVEWLNEYVEDSVLEQLVQEHEFVLLPHKDGTMISSGTFYFAISYGANVVGFDSQFIRMKAKEHQFVHRVNQNELKNSLVSLKPVPREEVLEQALQHYGESKIRDSWAPLLTK